MDTMDDYAVRLKKQFDKCDVDCSKLLEGDELVEMARWVWDTFHPDGEAIDAEVRTRCKLPLTHTHNQQAAPYAHAQPASSDQRAAPYDLHSCCQTPHGLPTHCLFPAQLVADPLR